MIVGVDDERAAVPPSRARSVAFFASLAALAGAAFWPSIRIGFILDDFGYLAVTLTDGWWMSGQIWDFGAQVLRPVTAIAIGIQHELFGFDPFPYHLVSLVLLVSAGVLLYGVARRLGLGVFGARAAAAVLVLHSTNGYTLMWTASTSSLWSVNLGLGVVLISSAPAPTRRRLAAAGAVFVVALLAREISMMLPVVVTMLRMHLASGGWWERARTGLREARVLWMVLAVYLVARLGFSGYAKLQPEVPRLVPILNWTSFSEALPDSPRHLYDLFLLASSPFRFQLLDSGLSFPWWIVLIAVVTWGLVVWRTVVEVRSGRTLALFGMGWFLACLFPPAFLQAEITYVNYADLAIPGLALAVGALAQTAVAGRSTIQRHAVAVAGLAVLTWVAFNGGNTLVTPPPPLITRAVELQEQARRDYPDPAPGSTLVIVDARPEDPLWSSNGDLFRVMYDDPTLVVVFEPPPDVPPDE